MAESFLLLGGALLAAGIAASLLAGSFRVPGLVVFLLVGVLAGPSFVGIAPEVSASVARDVGIVALALILFEGGLATGLPEIRPVLRPAIGLATVGTAATMGVVGLSAAWLLDLPLLSGLLLGAILSSTDGAAIFALLRGSTLRRRLARTLEGEAGMNDPIAALLVLGLIELQLDPDFGVPQLLGEMVLELGIDGVVGPLVGLAAVWALRRARLTGEGLYPVATLATAALAFGVSTALHGSGFLAVFLAGLVLGSGPLPAKQTVTAFHDGLAWVAQLAMFVVLGLLVNPSALPDALLPGIAIAAVLLFAGRPIGVFLVARAARFSTAETAALSWAGLRGAVPIIFATFPVLAGLPRAEAFVAIVFVVVVITTLVQGVSFEPLARRLRVTSTEPALERPLVEVGSVRRLGAELLEVPVRAADAMVGARVKDLGLPREALVSILVRGDDALLPRGSTRIHAEDRLHVLARQEVASELPDLVRRWRSGPVGPAPRPVRRHVSIAPIFRTGPWDPRDGDPSAPRSVGGSAVVERLLLRRDAPGCLVVLADGRFAVGGSVFLVGSRQAVQRRARQRLGRAAQDGEAVWWQEVIGACAS